MKPTMTMLVGLPGSMKTTYAQELAEKNGALVISSDEMRAILYDDENDQSNNNELFNIINASIVNSLDCKTDVIYDATNLKCKNRVHFLKQLDKVDCYKKCIVVATPYDVCVTNNKNRERSIPNLVINRMLKSFEMPSEFEGFDKVEVYYPSEGYKGRYGTPYRKVVELMDFSQDSKHHSLSLGEHLNRTYNDIHERFNIPELEYAALLHDIGKVETKSFYNAKGEKTESAHYYQHHCVGAYNSLFYDLQGVSNKEVATLISYHMYPYFWEKDDNVQMRTKYQQLWGDSFFSLIMALHEADKNAH